MPVPPALRALATTAALALAAVGALGCLDKADEHRVRANAFLRGNDAASALSECDQGLAARKDDLALLILRGNALFELDRMDDARAAYGRAVEVGGADSTAVTEAHLGLAMVASRKADWPAARAEFERLVKVNDRDATSQLNVARACLELRDMPCALEHGEAARRLRPREENIAYTLGTIYLAAEKTAEAKAEFGRICELVPGASSCPYGLALAAAKAGDKEAAITELGKAVDKKLPNPDRVATDPGFASLKDDERFQALAAKAAAAGK